MGIIRYIKSNDAQLIADEGIHYQRMVMQYNAFVWNGNPSECPQDKATPQRIKEIWNAEKLFLDCSKSEAIIQYSLIGFMNGYPFIQYDANGNLLGGTKNYCGAESIAEKDIEGNIINTHNNCISIPDEGLDGYDLSAFVFEIIEVTYHN